MLKLASLTVVAFGLAITPAFAMCCGGKGDASAKDGGTMQCMKMDMTKAEDRSVPDKTTEADPHAGMDMGKDGAMDHSKMAGCCCGCCGGKKSS
jgi:hypothetical protein